MAMKATFDADFGKFVAELNKVEVQLRKFEPATDKSTAKLKTLVDSLDGTKLFEQAAISVAAIEKIGGAASLSGKEIAIFGRQFDEAASKARAMGLTLGTAFDGIKGEIDGLVAKGKQLDTAITPSPGATRGFGAFQGAIAGIAASLTTQGLSAAKQFATDLVQTAGAVADLSAKTGLSTTEVQAFGYAAQQTGASVDTIAGAVTQLSNRLVEGGTGTVAAVKALGLSFADLQRQDPGAAFAAIADGIKDVPGAMEQTQLAIELFGKSGPELLAAIKAGLGDTAAEASRLGLVINEDAIQALDDLGDAWDRTALRAKVAVGNMAGSLGGAMRQIRSDLDLALKVAVQGSTNAMFAAGPFGALLGTYLRGRMGPMNEGDLAALGASTATGDIPLPVRPRPTPRPTPRDRTLEAIAQATAARRAELTGLAGVLKAQQTVTDLAAVGGVKALSPAQTLKIFDQLLDARTVAQAIKPDLVDGFTQALEQFADAPGVRAQAQEAGRKLIAGMLGPEAWRAAAGSLAGVQGQDLMRRIAGLAPGIGAPTEIADTYALQRALSGVGIPLKDINERTLKALGATKDWRQSIGSVSQAFGTLAQIAGGSLDKVSRGIGSVFGAANASLELVTALGKQFTGLFQGGDSAKGFSRTGSALAGGLAGLGIGAQLGSLTTNRGVGFAAGALGGAASGAMIMSGATPVGMAIGAGVGALVGGFAGMFAAAANASARRKAKDITAAQLTAQFGGLDALLETVGGLGLSQESFLKRFWGEPEAFALAVTELNAALEKERLEADKLGVSLGNVARAQGVLSRGDLGALAGARVGSQTEQLAKDFLAQQREQTAGGLAGASGALTRLAEITDADQFLTKFGAGLRAAGAGLFAVFDDAIQRGESALSILTRLGGPIGEIDALYAKTGAQAGAGFAQLRSLQGIATGEQTGPLVQLGAGLGSALSGLQNTGLLSPELFTEITAGITESIVNLNKLGVSGTDAARLMQPGLQSVWQLQQDFGFVVDEATGKLLEQAEAAGVIGDRFRPAEERIASGVGRLVELFEQFFGVIDELPGVAGRAAEGMNRAFDRVRPPDVPDIFGTPSATQQRQGSTASATATTASAGGAVYLDGAAVGYHTARNLDGVANFIGA